jgi:hypothetical protein
MIDSCMRKVDKSAQVQVEARETIAASGAPRVLGNLALAVLAGALFLVLWSAGMLLPSNLTTATVPGSWVRYGVETS